MYQLITKLPSQSRDLADSEVPALIRTIEAYRPHITVEDWKSFETRIAREWAIETGQIEGLYQFDRGVTTTLLEQGITPSYIPKSASHMSPEQVAATLTDHLNALDGLFAFVKGERRLSKSYIHELHVALLRNQTHHTVYSSVTNSYFEKELIKGQYKATPNSPTRPDGSVLEFCPPEHVEAEMDNLLQFHAEHEVEGWPIEISAAWLHHAFTHIHPYPDGNGRVARALATLVLIRGGLLPLVVPATEKQTAYIPSLEDADLGNYGRLVAAIRAWQARLLVQMSQRVRFDDNDRAKAASLEAFFHSVQLDLLRSGLKVPSEWQAVELHLKKLRSRGLRLLTEVNEKLSRSVKPDGGGWHYGLAEGTPNGHETRALADLGYELAAAATHVLQLHTKIPIEVGLTIGTIGPRRRGLGLATLTLRRIATDQARILGNIFFVTFSESEHDLEPRFAKWIEPLVLEALEEWRKVQFSA